MNASTSNLPTEQTETLLDLYALGDAPRVHYYIIAFNQKHHPSKHMKLTAVDAARGLYTINQNLKVATRVCKTAGCQGGPR
jgi:hypothetical protein